MTAVSPKISFFLIPLFNTGFNKSGEKRMRVKGVGFEFGVKLRPQKERMFFPWKLGNFHQNAIWRNAGKDHSGLF